MSTEKGYNEDSKDK